MRTLVSKAQLRNMLVRWSSPVLKRGRHFKKGYHTCFDIRRKNSDLDLIVYLIVYDLEDATRAVPELWQIQWQLGDKRFLKVALHSWKRVQSTATCQSFKLQKKKKKKRTLHNLRWNLKQWNRFLQSNHHVHKHTKSHPESSNQRHEKEATNKFKISLLNLTHQMKKIWKEFFSNF